MKSHPTEERDREERRARVIRTAEEVLARAFRGASRQEMIESQLRVREAVVREMRRRVT
jgi:hypothetical protein